MDPRLDHLSKPRHHSAASDVDHAVAHAQVAGDHVHRLALNARSIKGVPGCRFVWSIIISKLEMNIITVVVGEELEVDQAIQLLYGWLRQGLE